MLSAVSRRLVALSLGIVLAASLLAASLMPQGAAESQSKKSKPQGALAKLVNNEGERVGTVRFWRDRGAVLVLARVHDAEAGFHGFHVHETGVCDPDAPDGPFTSAGGHMAERGQEHGAHAGDMPSLFVTERHFSILRFRTDSFKISDLFDSDGSAVMIHEGPDNFANIPDRYTSSTSGQPGPDSETRSTGDAGARYACGVVERDRHR